MYKEYIEKKAAINAIEDTSCYLCKKFIGTKKCDCDCEIWRNKKIIYSIPTVPQEIPARELIHIVFIMFQNDLDEYDEYERYALTNRIDEAVQFAEKWSREHQKEEK